MPHTSVVLTQHAEDSSRLLFQTLASHRASVTHIPTDTTSRLRPNARDEELQVSHQTTLVRIVSITESFCSRRLIDAAEVILQPHRGELLSKIFEDKAIEGTATWDKTQRTYIDWFTAKPDWSSINGFIEARNAIAHGLGQITRRQRRTRQSSLSKLGANNIKVIGDQIQLNDDILHDAVVACHRLIAAVDYMLP